MRLSKILIDNFRSFSSFEMGVEDFTVIIGPNNVGKTSLLRALELLFYPGSDATVRMGRDDFRQADRSLVIEGIFSGLDQTDTQAFFSLRGSPGVAETGIRLEAKWESGEVVVERHVIRTDRTGDDRKVERYDHRFRQFISFSYVSPYRQPDESLRTTRGSDYRALVSTYAADFVEPLAALVADVQKLRQSVVDELSQRGEPTYEELDETNDVLTRVLDLVNAELLQTGGKVRNPEVVQTLSGLATTWTDAANRGAERLNKAIANGRSHVTHEMHSDFVQLQDKVIKLLQRCRVQATLWELRDTVMGASDFTSMQGTLSTVFDLLLPEVPPSVVPFPIQDDRLIGDITVQLGGADLLQNGSGFQSTFSIGLRLARILGEVSTQFRPRIVIIAVEEPEAHLHPHKQRHLASALRQLQETILRRHNLHVQFVLTSHSPNILAELSIGQLVILRSRDNTTQPTKLEEESFLHEWLDDMGITKQDRRTQIKALIRRWLNDFFRHLSEALFARCTILVEGYSEIGAFPIWARLLPLPNDLDQLGISVVLGHGQELTYGARVLEKLGASYVVVCDRADQHKLTGTDISRVCLTDHDEFEDEILASMPTWKVMNAVGLSLNESDLDSLLKYLACPKGVPGLRTATTWEEMTDRVKTGTLPNADIARLKQILGDHPVGGGHSRYLLKGSDVGALLALEATTLKDVPPAYLKALLTAQQIAGGSG